MKPGLLPIGTFARASLLSIGTLRHYHDTGLLVPVEVDARTGYRYYTGAQLVDAEVIRRLRDLDLPLDEVRTLLVARDERVTARVLQAHHDRMAARLQEAERIVATLHSLATEPLRLLADQVVVRQVADLDVVRLRFPIVGEAELGPQLGEAFARLATILDRPDLDCAGPAGAVYPDDWAESGSTISAYLPVAGPGRPPEWATLPGGRFAVVLHRGGYDSVAESYRGIGAWLAREGVPGGAEVRESYLVGPGDTPRRDDYRTEILWPLGPSTPKE